MNPKKRPAIVVWYEPGVHPATETDRGWYACPVGDRGNLSESFGEAEVNYGPMETAEDACAVASQEVQA